MCQNKTATTDEYQQATTLLLDIETNFNLNVTYSVKMEAEFYKLNIKVVDSYDSNFEVLSLFSMNFKIKAGISLFLKKFNMFFLKGHSFNDILNDTPLCWLDMN